MSDAIEKTRAEALEATRRADRLAERAERERDMLRVWLKEKDVKTAARDAARRQFDEATKALNVAARVVDAAQMHDNDVRTQARIALEGAQVRLNVARNDRDRARGRVDDAKSGLSYAERTWSEQELSCSVQAESLARTEAEERKARADADAAEDLVQAIEAAEVAADVAEAAIAAAEVDDVAEFNPVLACARLAKAVEAVRAQRKATERVVAARTRTETPR